MDNKYKDLFHLPEDVTFLNCSYMAPLLKSVEDIGIEAIRKRRSLHLTASEDFFTDVNALRQEFAAVKMAPREQIAVIPSVFYGVSTVAANLPIGKGENILMAGEQFPSNYYPWQRLAREKGATLKVIPAPDQVNERGAEWNRRILESIDARTRCVAISITHWADGTLFDIEGLRKKTDEVGAWLVIDGTQSIGALPFDVRKVRCDALICAGYKWLLGPYSLGLAYYGDALNDGKPIEENWINRKDSEDFKGLVNYTDEYQPGQMRFSVGEQSNFILVPMLLEAIRTVRKITPQYIQEHTAQISHAAFNDLRSEGFKIEEPPFRANHLAGIRLPEGVDPSECAATLKRAGLFVSWRGNALRVSPHVYNSSEDLQRLAKALKGSVKTHQL